MGFLSELQRKNAERQVEWDSSSQLDICFKALEFVGEVGELSNLIKKVKREELGLAGSRCDRSHLESEFGDVVITLSLLAAHLDIDLEAVTKSKFNKTSDKMGFITRFEGCV